MKSRCAGYEGEVRVWIGLEQLLEIQSLHGVSTDDEAIRCRSEKRGMHTWQMAEILDVEQIVAFYSCS